MAVSTPTSCEAVKTTETTETIEAGDEAWKLARFTAAYPVLELFSLRPMQDALVRTMWVEREILPWTNLWVPWEESLTPVEDWLRQRAGMSGEIEAAVERVLVAEAVPSEAVPWRRSVRLWTLARLDAVVTGDETWGAIPWAGGEPYLTRPLPQDRFVRHREWAMTTRTIRLGPSTSVVVGKRGRENRPLVLSLWSEEETVGAVEDILFPWLATVRSMGVAGWEKMAETKVFREWEQRSPYPLVMRSVLFPHHRPPGGICGLWDHQWLLETGIGCDTILALGLPLWMPEICYNASEAACAGLDSSQYAAMVRRHVLRLARMYGE